MATHFSTKLFFFACILSVATPSLCMEFKEQQSSLKKKHSKKKHTKHSQQEQDKTSIIQNSTQNTSPTQQEQQIEEPRVRELTPEEEQQIETAEKEKTQEAITTPEHSNSNWALVVHNKNNELLMSTTSVPSHFFNTPEETAQLTERKITPAVTTAQGMGAGWTAYTIVNSLTSSIVSLAIPTQVKKGSIILDDLINNRTTSDNSSCHHLLSDALREFALDGNIPLLVSLINNWFKKHYEMIVPEPCHAQQAHHALTTVNKAELAALKDGHIALNTKAFNDINKATCLIQQQWQTYCSQLTTLYNEYQKNGLALSDNHGDKYRSHKKTLCHLHQLAGIMELNTQDYCSDYEDENTADGYKIIKNSKHTKQTYTNRHLLKKIEMHKYNENTQKQITLIIDMANALCTKINELPELKYLDNK